MDTYCLLDSVSEVYVAQSAVWSGQLSMHCSEYNPKADRTDVQKDTFVQIFLYPAIVLALEPRL